MVKHPSSTYRKRRRTPTPYPELAELIRTRRMQLGVSQAFVHEQTGIDQSALSNWERGRTVPSGPLLVQLATYLGIELSALAEATKKPA